MAIVYRGRLWAYERKAKKIVNLMDVFRKAENVEGGRDYDENSFSFFDLEIEHAVNRVSKCTGSIVNQIGKDKESGALKPYSFAKTIFEAMNSNFQRHVYLTVSAVDLVRQSERVVFDGVLESMDATGWKKEYLMLGRLTDDSYIPFTAYGSSFLEDRAIRVFVPSEETLSTLMSRSYQTSKGPMPYGFREDKNWKFSVALKSEDKDAPKIAYRPNMVVKSSLFGYAVSLARLNGGYFYADDVKHTLSFIYGKDSCESKFEYDSFKTLVEPGPNGEPSSMYVGSYRIDESRVYGECTICGDDYYKASKAFMPSDDKNEGGGNNNEGNGDKKDGDEKPEINDATLGLASKKLEDITDDVSALAKESLLKVYVPCYDFKETTDDGRLYPGDAEGAGEIADRMLRTAAMSRTTLVLKVKPVVIPADEKTVPASAYFVVAPTPGDVFTYEINGRVQTFVVVAVKHESGGSNGNGGDILASVTIVGKRIDTSKKVASSAPNANVPGGDVPVGDVVGGAGPENDGLNALEGKESEDGISASADGFEEQQATTKKEIAKKEDAIAGEDNGSDIGSDDKKSERNEDNKSENNEDKKSEKADDKKSENEKSEKAEDKKSEKNEDNKSEKHPLSDYGDESFDDDKNVNQRGEWKKEDSKIEDASGSEESKNDGKVGGEKLSSGERPQDTGVGGEKLSQKEEEKKDLEKSLTKEYDEAIKKEDYRTAVETNKKLREQTGIEIINTDLDYDKAKKDIERGAMTDNELKQQRTPEEVRNMSEEDKERYVRAQYEEANQKGGYINYEADGSAAEHIEGQVPVRRPDIDAAVEGSIVNANGPRPQSIAGLDIIQEEPNDDFSED